MKGAFKHYFKIFLNLALTIISCLLVIFVVPELLLFFLPMVIGFIISRLANPLVAFLEVRIKIKRKAGSVFIIVAVISLVSLLGYAIISFLIRELVGFIEALPEIWRSVEADVSKVGRNLSGFYDNLPLTLREGLANFTDSIDAYLADFVSTISTPTVAAIGNFARNIPSILITVIMTLLSAYFFIAEKDYVIKHAKQYVPKSVQEKWKIIYTTSLGALGGYIKAQLKIEVVMYILLVIGFSILRVKYVALVALGIAFLDLWPILGTGTVLIPWAIIKIFGGDYKMAIGLLIIWGVGQLLRQIIQPKIVGDSLGVAPIPTLFLLFAGWQLGGVLGMIVAVPIGIIIANLNKAGAFSGAKQSVRILAADLNAFMKYTKKDRSYHKHYLEEDEKDTCAEDGEKQEISK